MFGSINNFLHYLNQLWPKFSDTMLCYWSTISCPIEILFFKWNKYASSSLYIILFLKTEMSQVAEIHFNRRQEHTSFI